jgi:hypothetical protein
MAFVVAEYQYSIGGLLYCAALADPASDRGRGGSTGVYSRGSGGRTQSARADDGALTLTDCTVVPARYAIMRYRRLKTIQLIEPRSPLRQTSAPTLLEQGRLADEPTNLHE